jgi:hypothetical protein
MVSLQRNTLPRNSLGSFCCGHIVRHRNRLQAPLFHLSLAIHPDCRSRFFYIHRDRRSRFALGILLIWQIATALISVPGEVAYANEAWGGSSHTHLYLSDSNTDWGQLLKMVKAYLDKHPGNPCYFAYFAQGPVDFTDYGIDCQQLPHLLRLMAGVRTNALRLRTDHLRNGFDQ